LTFTKFDAII